MVVPHCARGPTRCDKCKVAANNPQLCLVEVFLEHTNVARPIKKFPAIGKEEYYEYQVIRTFTDEAEARQYAKIHFEVQVLLK